MFGRATIRLGIGPHSSSDCIRCFDAVGSTWLGIRKSIGLAKILSDEVLAWLSV